MVVFRILPSWIMLLSIKPSGIPKQFTVETKKCAVFSNRQSLLKFANEIIILKFQIT